MKKQFIFGFLICIFLVNIISAYELNYTSSPNTDFSGLKITQLKYEPYPVNPGEYFDLWIKAEWTGTSNSNNVMFQLSPSYPFSLDSNEEATKDLGKLTNEPVVIKYKVRVDKDAVEGINNLDLRYNTDKSTNNWGVKTFDIQVVDAQTDFDLVIQESTGTEVSIAIANTGKNTANSLIVRIPEQENYMVSGTNGQMVGNLDSGDYTIVSFTLSQIGRNSASNSLQVQLDYTDSIGERRSIVKNVQFVSSSPLGNFTGGNGQRGNFVNQQTNTSVFSSIWFWVVIILIILVFYYLYRKGKLNFKNYKTEKNSKIIPEWVLSDRTKRR